MTFFHRKSNWQWKKYIYLANDLTSALLNKEKQKEDRRVRNLTIILIILAVVLVVLFAYAWRK